LDTGLSAACPAGGAACSVRVSLKVLRLSPFKRRRVKLFLTTKGPRYSIAPSDALAIRRLMTPAGKRLLERRGALRIIVRAMFRVGGGPVVVRQATIVVRRRR
ncbi:MAG: hypothetical protein M3389_07295, partial [Actinomycetota bacterium]|nr:hypothetical protein [Actinomycetota bacterium]